MKEIYIIPIALSIASFNAAYWHALSFQKHGCLSVETNKKLKKCDKKGISSSSSAGPLPKITGPSKVWVSSRGRSRKPWKLPEHPHKTGGDKGWGGLLSIGKDAVEPWRSESDIGYACWSWQTHTCSGITPGILVSQRLSLGWAVIGWETLSPFFLQRFPAQECHSPSAILDHTWHCYQWPCGLWKSSSN